MAAPVLEMTTLGLKRAWQGIEDELTSKSMTTGKSTWLSHG
ncbi:hypothetical protein [Sodalinema gerasimenkoae]|nr:hypothetical protein [Sodalinema gerasimenkoae]